MENGCVGRGICRLCHGAADRPNIRDGGLLRSMAQLGVNMGLVCAACAAGGADRACVVVDLSLRVGHRSAGAFDPSCPLAGQRYGEAVASEGGAGIDLMACLKL